MRTPMGIHSSLLTSSNPCTCAGPRCEPVHNNTRPTVGSYEQAVSYEEAVSYERGTPGTALFLMKARAPSRAAV